ncbi:hypothetical protein F5148DRAFT_1215570 [Russula earlei]|uniref:Uncharacterized protein n=1 Tax=Russula earlei TaxID=71964 RepID=A0ACC0U3I2_9AGAM|nr:hypothetical protein F5148DRAFT_1215570 [Russula earlei]
MTVPSLDQVVAAIKPSASCRGDASHKQSKESWATTKEALNRISALVQGCGAGDFDAGSELQQPLSDLQSDLEATHAACQRYSSSKKKGAVLRVSGVLPKWIRIRLISENFEDAVRQREKHRDHVSTTARPSSVSGNSTKQFGPPIRIQERVGTSEPNGINERYTDSKSDVRKIPAPPSTVSFPAEEAAEMHLESEELVMEDPADWAIILTEMRNNVQSRAASLLGRGPHDLGDRDGPVVSRKSKPSSTKGISQIISQGGRPSTQSNLTPELRRLETQLLMQIASFSQPDLCPPHEYLQAVQLTPSYPIVLSGYSWEVTIRYTSLPWKPGSPEAATKLFDLSQTLADLCMHHYSYTVATWALFLRRGLYNADKDMHRRDLASVLCQKARMLTALGRTKAALNCSCYEDEALQGVQLAKALLVQAPLLHAAGRKSEAKVVARRMVSILEDLGEDKSHLKHLLSLARASLSDIFLDMEEYDEALSARSLIGLVDSRTALSIALLIKARVKAARGEDDSAYTSAIQAVRHLRDLASERPGFTMFLANALVLSSRYLQAAEFPWEARKCAKEAVELYRALYTSAPEAFASHYAEGSRPEVEVFDLAQHAEGLFREASIRDSEALAAVLLVIASSLFGAAQVEEAAAPAEEAVGILRPRWKREPQKHAPRFVRALELAAACRPSTEAGLEHAKEAVEVHRPRKDLEQDTHDQTLTRLLMDVFLRLRELGREVEAIPYKTEAARMNPDVVESVDPPADATRFKGLPGGIAEYGSGSEGEEDI